MATPNDTGWQDLNPQGQAAPQSAPAAQPAQDAQSNAPAQQKLSADDTGWQDVSQNNSNSPAQQSSPKVGGAGGTWAESKAGPKEEHPAAQHGLLRRAWDYANTPIADFVLPHGVKTGDIIRAAAFEKMFGEAYIPGINDFETKAETHLGDSPTKAALKQFIAGSVSDTSDVAAGFTSPLAIATMGSEKAAATIPGNAGRVARVIGPLAGSAFTLQGAGQAVEGGSDIVQHGANAENLSQVTGGLGQALLGGAGLHEQVRGELNRASQHVRESATPTTETSPMGAQIPVRSDTTIGKAVAAGAPEQAAEFAQTRTAPAVQQAVGGTIGEATGSGAKTVSTPEDRMGVKAHAQDLIENQARPVFKRVDELSGNKLTDAQNKISTGWSQMDKAKIAEGELEKSTLYDKYREQLKSEGLDVDDAERNYAKGKATERMAKRLDTATGPSNVEGAPYELDGKKLMKVVDDGVKNGSWKRMGLTDEHVNELQSLAKTAAKQTEIPKVNAAVRAMGKLAVAAAGLHGGMLPAVEAMTGVSAADYVGGKISKHILQDAMLNYDATQAANQAIKTGNVQPVINALSKNPGWMERTKTYVRDTVKRLIQDETGSAGAPGTVFSPEEVQQMKSIGMSEEDIADMQKDKPKFPSSDSLIRKYGESDDPGHTAFITSDGRGVAQTGVEHDTMVGGGKGVPGNGSQRVSDFVDQGNIRVRARTGRGGREFNLSIPKEGISEAQLEKLKKWSAQMGSGTVNIESTKPGAPFKTIEYGKASTDLEKSIRDMVPVKPTPETSEALKIARAHNANQGFTYNPAQGFIKDKPVFSVAGEHPDLEKVVPKQNLTEKDIKSYMDKPEVRAALDADPDLSIGGWVYKGKTHLEVSRLFKDRDAAVAAGKKLNQESIYDHANKTSISTGGTAADEAQSSQSDEGSTTMNASGESSASVEAQNRLRSQQAQGLRVYDVDSRMANSAQAWHPVMASVDRIDQTAQPFHHLVQLDPKTGEVQILDSGKGAKPLPASDRIQSLLQQATGETAPARAASPEADYRQGLASKELGTRQPFSANASTAVAPENLSGLDALNEADKQAPARMTQTGKPVLGIKQKLVAALGEYKDNGISHILDAADPNAAIENFVNHAKENLKWLHNATPEVIRSAAKQWYETAHDTTKQMAERNGISHEQAAAVTAALSPQNDWNNNVGLAHRVVEHWNNDQNHAWTSDMDSAASRIRNDGQVSEPMKRVIDNLRGKKYTQLTAKTPEALLAKKALWIRILDEAHGADSTPIYNPNGTVSGSQTVAWGSVDPVAKSLSILENGDLNNINAVMGNGHKIRNFYNNIINPWSDRGHATIDTHQVGASLLKPFSGDDVEVQHNFGSGNRAGTASPAKHAGTGLKGSYPVYEEAIRRAAADLGLRPRELQSITWEGVRSLMGDVKKTPELRKAVARIWQDHEMGKITLDQAREKIVDASGGFSKPNWLSDEEWERSGGSPEQGQTDFSFGENKE